MSTKAKEVAIIPPKPLTVIERAAAVFAAVPSDDELRELAKKSATITEITNAAGKDQCHAARMMLKNTRLEIARVGEEGREDAVQTSKAIIALQKSRIALISGEEARLQAIQDEWDARIEREREAKVQAELARVDAINKRIEALRNLPIAATGKPSTIVDQMVTDATNTIIDEAVFEERTDDAKSVLRTSLAALVGIHAERKAHEAEQDRIVAERAELAKLRAEQQDRERIAAEDRRQQEAADKLKRDAEAAAQAEANRQERERIAREEADAKAIRDSEAAKLAQERAENARIAREAQAALDAKAEEQRKANAAEAVRIAAERAKLEAEQAAAKKAAEPKLEPVKNRTVERPTTAQLVALVSSHYSVSLDMAEKWLRALRFESAAAA
ncbi:MAG: hypothetical protein M3O26_16400 [Pseudomonadota bacterium]|nr:hypothetical protein [Pseudomonadota bacterium]